MSFFLFLFLCFFSVSVWAAPEPTVDRIVLPSTDEINTPYQPSSSTVHAASHETNHQKKNNHGIVSFTLENDLVVSEDRNYTNGARLSWLSPQDAKVPDWIENIGSWLTLFHRESVGRYGLSMGQNLYTPSDIRVSELLTKDRPYAAWLYLSAGLVAEVPEKGILENLELQVGMVGPAAQGEETQRFVHQYSNSPDPRGWDYQLKNELGVMLTYERKWQNKWERERNGWGVDLTPHMGLALGNVMTYAAAGGMFRVGYDLPVDYGPPRVRPSLPGSDFFYDRPGFYFFVGLEGRAVARNIFLDGNTFRESHSVEKKDLVGDLQVGLSSTFSGWRVAYTHVWRTKEFVTQKTDYDVFGALTLSKAF